MAPEDNSLQELQNAVRLSPENVPLRRALADGLLAAGHPDQAEEHYRQAVRLSGGEPGHKLGLARAYLAQNKQNVAVVVLEELAALEPPLPEADLLYAQFLADADNAGRARFYYRRAIEADPDLADEQLARSIGAEPPATTGSPDATVDAQGRQRNLRDDVVSPEDGGPDTERPKINFEAVGGMDRVKDEIRMKIVHPLQHKELFKAYGKAIGGGILMYGPPGCGKTYLARATAGEVDADFLCVGLSDILDMYVGNSEARLHEVFQRARKAAPCVVFFDEVDALGAKRSDMRTSAGRTVINQFLAELDGAEYSNDGLLILAATNAPWHLDPALRRPGRFDRVIFVPPPDAAARTEILRLCLAGKPAEDVDLDAVASRLKGFSGADIRSLVDVAVEDKLQDAIKTGQPAPLTTRDLKRAAKRITAVAGEWFATARNYATYANDNGMYDDVLKYDAGK
jgi:AAA+ superfamily predicted ATPase